MELPEHRVATTTNPDMTAIAGCIRTIAAEEPEENRQIIDQLEHGDPFRVGLLIARSCIIIANPSGPDRSADKLLRRAQREIEPIAKNPGRRFGAMGNVAVQLYHLADLVQARDDVLGAQAARTAMNAETIKDIRAELHLLARPNHSLPTSHPNHPRRVFGNLAADTVHGLLTRNLPSGFLSVMALPHRDRGTGANCPGNLDYWTIEAGPVDDQEQTTRIMSAKLQIKNDCLGFCIDEGDITDAMRETRNTTRGRYSSDITLISGHCDLGIKTARGGKACELPLTELLLEEASGNASIGDVTQLNIATAMLRHQIKTDENRVGVRKPVSMPRQYQPLVTPTNARAALV